MAYVYNVDVDCRGEICGDRINVMILHHVIVT